MADIALSVVIPTCNNLNGLTHLIQSLCQQTLSSYNFEVVVIDYSDNNETDNYIKSKTFFIELTCHDNMGEGLAAARNSGVHHAVGDHILFLSDDMIAPPTLLEQHLLGHKKNQRQIVRGPIYPLDYGDYQTDVPEMPEDMQAATLFFDVRNTSIPKLGLAKVEGFNEDLKEADDNREIYWRLKQEKYPEQFIPASYCYQQKDNCIPRDLESLKKQAQEMAKAAVRLYIRKPTPSTKSAIGIGLFEKLAHIFPGWLTYNVARSLTDDQAETGNSVKLWAAQSLYEHYYRDLLFEEFEAYGLI